MVVYVNALDVIVFSYYTPPNTEKNLIKFIDLAEIDKFSSHNT